MDNHKNKILIKIKWEQYKLIVNRNDKESMMIKKAEQYRLTVIKNP